MDNKDAYNLLYTNMNNGVYNEVVRTWEKNLAPSSEISVRLVKKDCKQHDVDFEVFLKYAQDRKKKEETK